MQMQKLVTESGIEHGLVEQIGNCIKDDGYKNLSESNRKEMLERRKKDLTLVKGTYQNLDDQENGKHEGWYGDYAGEPLRSFRFLHGNTYVMPRGWARKINALSAPVRSGLIDPNGNELIRDGKLKRSHMIVADSDF